MSSHNPTFNHSGYSNTFRTGARDWARSWSGVFCVFIAIAALGLWSEDANAYEQYHPSDSTNTGDGCYQCHGWDNDANPAAALDPAGCAATNTCRFRNDGFDQRGPLHDMHVSQITGTCDLCHQSTGDVPFTYMSGNPEGQGCRGCHGVDNGTMFNWGAGLRAHHANAGAPNDQTGLACADCHSADPAPSPESTVPVYYARSDVNAKDPCNADGTEDWGSLSPFDPTLPDGLGLDNDGDLVYDAADSDCAANQAPNVTTPGDQTNTVGDSVSLQIVASDPDGDNLSYAATGLPTGLSINASTGLITGTTTAAGSFAVTVTVTDDGTPNLSTDVSFNWTVNAAPNEPPTADPNGPYRAVVGETITFDGSGSTDVDGTIASYMWDFGDGSPMGTGVSPSHTYAAAGTYTVSLTVTDDDGATDTASTTATIGAVNIDLDIAQFRVTKRVRLGGNKPPEVSIMLTVKNNGDFNDQTRPATLTGVQNGVIVYTEAQEVSDPLGNGRSRYLFGPYVPTVAGDIAWTMVIADDDPDDDVATEVTLVR